MLRTRWLAKPLAYDGAALSPLWAYRTFGLKGPSAVSFAGPCNVPLTGLVDQEDVRLKAPIASRLMLHLIATILIFTLRNLTVLNYFFLCINIID